MIRRFRPGPSYSGPKFVDDVLVDAENHPNKYFSPIKDGVWLPMNRPLTRILAEGWWVEVTNAAWDVSEGL